MGDARMCPFKGCTATTHRDKFLCGPHWLRVPRSHQTAIYAAWRRYKRDPRSAAGELRAAQQDALEAIGGK